mmetsp:Transcript_33667/g.50511  ORF Transcript_33667/g.50511 Transcript_33667/m.50511 type:complete len:952 (-) Transcript_33667:47-2902(-)
MRSSSSSSQQPTAFVGGAERARRNARKRQSMPNPNFHRKRHWKNECYATTSSPYPKSMKVNDRFFGSLLSSSTKRLSESESDAAAYQAVMQQACSLLSVPCIATPAKLINSPLLKKLDASKDDARSHHLLQRSCSFLSNASSTTSTSTSSSTYENAREYYMSKAPLILEESRYILSESIAKQAHRRRDICSFQLEFISMEERYPNISYDLRQYSPLQLTFRITDTSCKEKSSSKYTRPGSVFLISQSQLSQQKRRGKINDKEDNHSSSVLACIMPSYQSRSKNSKGDDSNTVCLMIFNRDGIDLRQLSDCIGEDTDNNAKEKVVFRASFLVTLISYSRQMDASLRMAKVPFMPKLLGQKNATHIRFNDSSDDEEDEEIVCDIDEEHQIQEGFYVDEGEEGTTDNTEDDDDEVESRNSLAALLDKLPKLNPTQERAAKSFLDSRNSLQLVQGPPGTGKSTFLVNVICRRLATDSKARILVTAPTNRAVTVLAQRFLDVVNSCDGDLLHDCNAVLVGVEDKLIPNNTNDPGYMAVDTLPSSLQSIFAYTWTDSIKNEYVNIIKSLKTSRVSFDALVKDATNISNKLCNSLPGARTVIHYSWRIVQELTIAMQENDPVYQEFLVGGGPSVSPVDTAISHIELLIDALDEFDNAVPELLSTARVIFCTLSTAGASILKQTRKIDDVLIDEAACATECEIAIPFHLRPDRCLAVGDPLQLPPTIMSPHAAELGLSRSMHARLMNDCGHEFVMLDYQYRMKPPISSFPNAQFYDGKILDGKNVVSKDYSSRFSLRPEIPYSFINVPEGKEFQDSGGSYANKEECDVVVDLVEIISTLSGKADLDEDRLRIITFYQGQVNHLKRVLAKKGFHGVMVATVDSSQGCEADVIIVSFVRSSDKKGVYHATGFLADDRRINVALTRARHQLVCVGNKGTLGSEGSEVLRNLVLDAEQRGCIV